MENKALAQELLQEGNGVLRLAPAWVPRSFCRPGRRLKLHPDDYYALGLERGGIDERWFASTTHAENGPETPADEGLSYVVSKDGSKKMLLKDMVELLQEQIIGSYLWDKYGRWPAYSKFFDNQGPLPHHIHHRNEHAALTGQLGKPEMYFFPAQMNNYRAERAETYFGLNPGTTREDLKKSLMNFTKGDNKILELSRAYKLEVDTGYDVPAGVLHAPGTLCTYEPQFASDVFAMYQSVLWGDHAVPENLLWKDTPEDKLGDFDHLVDILDWEKNVDPEFHKHYFMAPKPVRPVEEMEKEGYIEEWICYKCPLASAKRLTVLPGQTVTIHDGAAYGLIMLQGHGTLNQWTLETPTQIRFGQLTNDEYFVTEDAAKKGVTIHNTSNCDPIVMLKHFSENPDLIIEG